MDIVHHGAWFFGGAFLINTIPHTVSGLMGRPFQSPFATPPGVGLSSSTVNVLWGFLNLVVAWLLLVDTGHFDIRAWDHALAAGLGGLAMALFAARHFGHINGGNLPPPRTLPTPP